MPLLPQHATFGFTAPTDIYDVMRSVKTSADALHRDVLANVADPAFRTAWLAWYQEWNAFFERNYRTFGTLLHTDELKAQTEAYRLQLLSWYDAYARQTTPVGTPVPPAAGVPPLRPGPGVPTQGAPPSTNGASEPLIPWWGWVLGGAALVGVGYYGYKRYLAPDRSLLPRMGAGRDYILSARDPDYWSSLPVSSRDLHERGYRPVGNPLRAESYAIAVEVQEPAPPPALPPHAPHDHAPPRGGYR